MKTNKAGLDLIKSFEGLKLQSYKCPADVWTIGYGSTGKDIGPGMTWTTVQAEERLAKDLVKFELAVQHMLTVAVNENQFSALVCFCYNIGEGALGKSTLIKMLNAGDAGAADQFLRWNKAGGKELAGLTRRRVAERDLFNKPVACGNKLGNGPSDHDIQVKLEEIEKGVLK